MTTPNAEMHQIFGRISSMWVGTSRAITEDDRREGRVAEVIRWRRDKLGGRDQDLCGPNRWEAACSAGWSIDATYSFLAMKADTTWPTYVHDTAHNIYTTLGVEVRSFGAHSLEQARIELELTELVVGWLKDEARGVKHTFEPLKLSRPSR